MNPSLSVFPLSTDSNFFFLSIFNIYKENYGSKSDKVSQLPGFTAVWLHGVPM